MNLSLLVDKWEAKKAGREACQVAVLDECISDLKMTITGEMRPANRLDSLCHFKKHKGKTWQQVIEEDVNYVNWCLENIGGFMLDEIAFAYLIENGG